MGLGFKEKNGYAFKKGNSVDIVLPTFWKGVNSKRKELAPKGSQFFPFRVDPSSEGAWCAGKQTGSHKSHLPCNKCLKICQMYHSS